METRSSTESVAEALARAESVEPLVNAICTLNGRALDDAAEVDHNGAEGNPDRPLRGVPVLVKDNVDTADLLTTAGSLALADRPPTPDAPIVRSLRDTGAVILGKANLSEWANIRDSNSVSGWSAYGGLTRNPYGLNRSAGGSSSGSAAAVAAGIVRFAVGSETDGSVVCPAALTGCVGLKPTVGLVSTAGIVPISWSQDTPGTLTTTVAEAAQLLGVLAVPEPRRSVHGRQAGVDYASYAVRGSLAGTRIGVPRRTYWGYSPGADAAAEEAVRLLAAAGATIVDETNLDPEVEDCIESEIMVMLAELRAGLADYLSTRPAGAPRSLDEVVAFNREHSEAELVFFGQDLFEASLAGPDIDSAEYVAARERCARAARTNGIDAVLGEHDLDALVSPTYAPAWPIDTVNPESHLGSCSSPAAMAGYPLLTVPAGMTGGLPVGVCLWGAPWSEPTLLTIAATYEAARDESGGSLPPPTFPTFV